MLCSLLWLTLALLPPVHTWGAGNDGELGHGQISKTGMRNSYEELLPRQVETAPAGCTHIGLGKTHNGLGKCASLPPWLHLSGDTGFQSLRYSHIHVFAAVVGRSVR